MPVISPLMPVPDVTASLDVISRWPEADAFQAGTKKKITIFKNVATKSICIFDI